MKTAEITIEMQRIWIDCTEGMIQDTFWMTWLTGVCPSHCAKPCRVIASDAPLVSPVLMYAERRRHPQGG